MEYRTEILISIIFAALVVLFLDPFMLWMSDSLMYMLLGALVVVSAIFAGLVWKERSLDEREQLHKHIAGRAGYLIGVGVLVIGLVAQTVTGYPDPWIVVALGAMIIGKLVGLLYGRSRF